MDRRPYIKPAGRLTVRDRNIENNDHSNMYQRLKIEWCGEVQAKSEAESFRPSQLF